MPSSMRQRSLSPALSSPQKRERSMSPSITPINEQPPQPSKKKQRIEQFKAKKKQLKKTIQDETTPKEIRAQIILLATQDTEKQKMTKIETKDFIDLITENTEKVVEDIPSWFDWKAKNKNKKNTLIIALSAIRCTEIIHCIHDKSYRIGKLFGKHLKIKDQIELLKNDGKGGEHPSIFIGTTSRLAKLEQEYPHLGKFDTILLDMKADKRQMDVLKDNESRASFWQVLKNVNGSIGAVRDQ